VTDIVTKLDGDLVLADIIAMLHGHLMFAGAPPPAAAAYAAFDAQPLKMQ